MPAEARDGKDVADEPEPLRMLQRDVEWVKTALQEGEHRRIGVDVVRQEYGHAAAKGEDHDEVQGQAATEEEGTGDPAVEPDHREEQDGAEDIQRPGHRDGRLGMGRAKDGNRDFDGKRRDQELEVPDLDLAQPPDVASDQDRNHQRGGDDREEEEHLTRCLQRRRCWLFAQTCRPEVLKGQSDKGRTNEQRSGRNKHERRTHSIVERTRDCHPS